MQQQKRKLQRNKDEKGFPRYVWDDGCWYGYEYSSSDITLDIYDEDFALTLLEKMDEAEGDVYFVDCEALAGINAGYTFHVVYRNESALDGEPAEETFTGR